MSEILTPRFRLFFYNAEAVREYKRLDGSVKPLVEIGYRKLAERADEIGKPLHGKLAGCKELKYRKYGIRIIFRIINDATVEIVEIVATGKREMDKVFVVAESRLGNPPDHGDLGLLYDHDE